MLIAQLSQQKKDKTKKCEMSEQETDEIRENFKHFADVILRKHQPLLHHFALSCLNAERAPFYILYKFNNVNNALPCLTTDA